jgi:predicted helicase
MVSFADNYNRLIFATSPWGSNAEKSIHNQTIPVIRLGLKDLDDSPVDWSKFDSNQLQALKNKSILRDYQSDAIEAVILFFASSHQLYVQILKLVMTTKI